MPYASTMSHWKSSLGTALALLVGACTHQGQDGLCGGPDCWSTPEDNSSSGGIDDGSGGGTDATATAGEDDSISGGEGEQIPCDVQQALAAGCGLCHGPDPAFGAPMSLASFDDFMVPGPSDSTRPNYELVVERMTAETGVMPPNGEISDDDASAILDWIDAGLPREPEDRCDDLPGGTDGGTGPEHLPCEVRYALVAHADGSDQPFAVPALGADDLHQCFAFRSPFPAGEQATAWAPIIDDQRVVRQWTLYRDSDGNYTDGAAFPCDPALQHNADFVAGWAPGGDNVVLPDDVGLDLGLPDDWYILQLHYDNTAHHPDVLDQSGVAFCSTPTPRENRAGVLTLGSMAINIPPGAQDHEVDGTCGPLSTLQWGQPLYLFGASPHMHELGRSLRTERRRLLSNTEIVTDVPAFDFESQAWYAIEPEIVVLPGDTLHTTCVYDNPTDHSVIFGEGTSNERCFNFVLAYPIDALPDRNCFF